MALNPNIILAGRPVDVIGAMEAGNIAGQRARQFQDANALNGFMRERGADVLRNDAGAVNALAQMGTEGLQMAQGVQGNALNMEATRLGMDQTRQSMSLARKQDARLDRAEEMKIAAYAQSIGAEKAAQEAAQIKQAVAGGLAAQTPEQWDAFVGSMAPDLVGQFENREMIAQQYLSVADALERNTASDTVSYIATGERAAALNLDPEGAYNVTSGPGGMKATAIGGGGTNVTVNNGPSNPMPGLSKLGEGMTYQYNPDGTVKMDENGTPIAVPIEGTDRAEERATADRASQQARLNYDRKFNIVGTKLNQAIAQLEEGGRWVAGRGSLLSGIPETDARDFQATVDTIKANLGFEELQAMRDSSPTGGALGQVTEREIAFLQAIQGNLDTAQSPEQLMSVLMELKQGREQFKRERDAILGQQDTQLSDDDLLRMYGGE